MKYELIELSENDGRAIFDFLNTIPKFELGYKNKFHGMTYAQYQEELKLRVQRSKGIGLPEGKVPRTTYWFHLEGKPAGVVNIRHRLSPLLRLEGGNLSYVIAPAFRGKGYAKIMLDLALTKAREDHNLKEILVTVLSENVVSRRVIENYGAVLEKESDGRRYYWFTN